MTFPTIPFGTVTQRNTSVRPSAFGAKFLPVDVLAIARIAETGGTIVILTTAPPIVSRAITVCSSIAIVLTLASGTTREDMHKTTWRTAQHKIKRSK